MFAEPQKEHAWLEQLLGEWTMESEADCGEGQAPMRSQGRESVRLLAAPPADKGLWVLCEGSGQMPDGPDCRMLLTLGYDPARQRYVGSWVGSMMANMFVYEGQLDASGKVLVLETEGPSFTGEGRSPYRDTITIVGPDERTLTSSAPQPDGSWKTFMRATYRRVR